MDLDSTIYNLQVLFGMIVFFLALKKYPDILKIEFSQVKRFTLALLLITTVQAIFLAYTGKETYIDNIYMNGINSLAGVWWEDSCYVLPYLIASKLLKNKSYLMFPFFVASSAYFSLGHAYQGPSGYVTFLFPFISYHYAKKYGAGTTMICHVIYDTMLVMSLSGLKNLLIGLT